VSRMGIWGAVEGFFRRQKSEDRSAANPDFADLLGMTTPMERAWLWRYGRRQFTGKGAVVDLGCWLGSTTIPLVDGLRGNANFRRLGLPVHVYDSFVWESWMDRVVVGTELAGRFQPGDSFQCEFALRAKAYASELEVHAGDLAAIGWCGGAIEFLLVDAMKSWELARATLRLFYPHLIPGTSVVFHQDFCHYYTYWIHLLQFRLRKWFAFQEDVPSSSSTAFRNTGRIPSELLNREWAKADFSSAEVEEAFAYSLEFVRVENREAVQAAKIMCLADLGFIDLARTELDGARAMGCNQYDMQMVGALPGLGAAAR